MSNRVLIVQTTVARWYWHPEERVIVRILKHSSIAHETIELHFRQNNVNLATHRALLREASFVRGVE